MGGRNVGGGYYHAMYSCFHRLCAPRLFPVGKYYPNVARAAVEKHYDTNSSHENPAVYIVCTMGRTVSRTDPRYTNDATNSGGDLYLPGLENARSPPVHADTPAGERLECLSSLRSGAPATLPLSPKLAPV